MLSFVALYSLQINTNYYLLLNLLFISFANIARELPVSNHVLYSHEHAPDDIFRITNAQDKQGKSRVAKA